MRLFALLLLLIPAAGMAQAISAPPARPETVTPPPVDEVNPDDRAKPLAAKSGHKILSENEIYNRSRASDGRLGVRLGNDMSYRISGH